MRDANTSSRCRHPILSCWSCVRHSVIPGQRLAVLQEEKPSLEISTYKNSCNKGTGRRKSTTWSAPNAASQRSREADRMLLEKFMQQPCRNSMWDGRPHMEGAQITSFLEDQWSVVCNQCHGRAKFEEPATYLYVASKTLLGPCKEQKRRSVATFFRTVGSERGQPFWQGVWSRRP